MKRRISLILALVAIVTICLSCTMTERCAAYADNSTTSEQQG